MGVRIRPLLPAGGLSADVRLRTGAPGEPHREALTQEELVDE